MRMTRCRKCGGTMRPGKAILQTYVRGMGDFGDDDIITVSAGGPGHLTKVMKCAHCGWSRMPTEHDDLRAEIERLREALAFYANEADYLPPLTGGKGKLWQDAGMTAREALEDDDQ